jgi:hypothetical protein
MIKEVLLWGTLTFVLPFSLLAQEQLNHPKKVFVSPEGKIFINKEAPIYFRVATSPDDNAPSYLLPSEETKKYSNPMYFDTEGKNTLRSPSAVDPVTKKTIQPLRDVLFEMYSDGKTPLTGADIVTNKKKITGAVVYYGKETKIDFKAADEVSGVEASYVSVNGSAYTQITKENSSFGEEKDFSVKYYSVDNVGNVETPKELKFSIDLSAPQTKLSIIGENKGKVLSSKAAISLTSKDTLSGVSRIMYSINDGPEKVYTTPIPLSILKEGETKIVYYAVDNVGNTEDQKVISTSTKKPEKEEASSYSFYIDKEAPVVSFEIVGDQFKGKSLYISGRSQFQINANDEKSGVDKVTYSQNSLSLNQTYTAPFSVNGEGIQSVSYAASDYVGNYALAQTQQLVIDKVNPKSSLTFIGKQFSNRDTLFITKDTKLSVYSVEAGAGIQKILYSVDGLSKETYSSPFAVEKDGFHVVEYNAVDNVNNTEAANKKSFIVDNVAPEIHYNFSVKAIGEKTVRNESYTIYPSNVMLYIAATDNASGVDRIEYKINGKPAQSIIPVKGFIPGNYDIEIIAYDVLKNRTSQIVRFSIEN